MKLPRAWIATAALLAACSIARFPPAAPSRTATVGLTITTATLPNGQRVVLVNDPHAIDVQITMRYQVGAVDDLETQGLAHFVEHLMFQQVVDGQSLFTHFEDTATFFNAYTSYDATTFVSRGPAVQLDKLLALEAARLELRCDTITDTAFTREREVVINEVKERDQVSEVYGAIHSVLYPGNHPYRQRIGGTVQSVGSITREQACGFADTYFAPSNAVLVVSGNLGDRAQPALDKFAAAVKKRVAASARPVPKATLQPQHVEAPAPIDRDVLVLAWPLPLEPEVQTQTRAVAAALVRLVDSEIKGTVVSLDFGDRRAPMFGLAVLPADDETFQEATMGARRGIEKLPGVFEQTDNFDDVVFSRIREGAIYGLYSSLEDGTDRDTRLATYVLAGRDPNAAFAADLQALRNLTRERGTELARRFLDANMPTVVTLKATGDKKRGQTLALRKPVHDMGARRNPPDPALANQPAEDATPRDVVRAQTRRLANGLEVVLLPMSSVPTVDIRLVVHAGTADEPVTHRGIASLTAHALSWDLRYLNDLVAFASAGGIKNADVGVDRTSFAVQGMDTHLDVLLAGLRRWVRDGTFDDDSAKLVISMRRAQKRADDEGVLTDTWRAALFGAEHPYVRAGIVRHANSALTLDDAAQFRARHYTPSNATLVIAGHFDPALATQWIDFLFADWSGPAAPRHRVHTASQPASIAKVEDLAMVQVRIALPAAATTRAEQLVAAEMLAEIARDVRFQLAAGYSVDAQLSEQRLAKHYLIGGWVDASRSAAAIQLIRERIQRLRTEPDAAARAFVTARKHVIAQLLARVGSAESLATRVERDVAMERAPMSDLQTAAAVKALTIEGMSATLAELDLGSAAVLMRGPAAELDAAFRALGRTPSYVKEASTAAGIAPPNMTAPIGTTSAPVLMSDVQPALTERPPPRLLVTAALNAMAGLLLEGEFPTEGTGRSLAFHVGYRYKRDRAFGVRTSIGTFDGTSEDSFEELSVMPFSLNAFWHYVGPQGYWATLGAGLRAEQVTDMTSTRWLTNLGFSFDAGFDLVTIGSHRMGIVVSAEILNFLAFSAGSATLSAGLVYRR